MGAALAYVEPLMFTIDRVTFVLIVLTGIDVGFAALFGWNPASKYLGAQFNIASIIVGCGAIWQFVRQRWL